MSRIVLTRRLALGLSSDAGFSRCSAMVRVRRAVASGVHEPAGSARLELVSGVALLREEDAVLEAMLAGGGKQQSGGGGGAPGTGERGAGGVRPRSPHPRAHARGS